jgi:hypothetical protein
MWIYIHVTLPVQGLCFASLPAADPSPETAGMPVVGAPVRLFSLERKTPVRRTLEEDP